MSADGPDSPDLAAAKRVLDDLKAAGFTFARVGPGEDAPLRGHRVTGRWVDTLYIDGFSRDCTGCRQWRSALIVPGEGVVERRVSGGALSVLSEVATWETDQFALGE